MLLARGPNAVHPRAECGSPEGRMPLAAGPNAARRRAERRSPQGRTPFAAGPNAVRPYVLVAATPRCDLMPLKV
jgi:hypothetical protein